MDKDDDDGVGAKAYSHEKMKNLDSFYCYMCRNLVVIGEMVDVNLTKKFLCF